MKKATLLSEQHNFADAVSIAIQILQSIGENYTEQDFLYQNELDIPYYCSEAGEIIMNVVKTP